MELSTPGSAVRLASVARHVTDCAMRPGATRLKPFSDRLVKPGIKPVTPDLQGKWCIRYTTVAPFCSISPVSSIFTLSCQPGVTVTSCFVYKVIRDIESIDHLCSNPILWIGLIHK